MSRLPTLAGLRERLVLGRIDTARLPRHVGFIPDGNRRWASVRQVSRYDGHRRGAERIQDVLCWCEQIGIEVVTLFMLSSGNLARAHEEGLYGFTEHVVRRLANQARWRLHPIGSLDLLPDTTRCVITTVAEQTRGNQGLLINAALGYAGRRDIVAAVHAFLRDPAVRAADAEKMAELLTVDTVDGHISTAGQPDVDLIIRTSGEQRLSGFLTWQAEQAELHFCRRNWPDFRRIDLLRALRSYTRRERRFGI
jgi:short-chain Z-isoprenyl diphosphate synthase